MMSTNARKETPKVFIIREVYDSASPQQYFENELDQALESGVESIVIEPTDLGDETGRWIATGNFLHKASVLSGFGSIICGIVWKDKLWASVSLGVVSAFSSSFYFISWQNDPCCKYQVVSNSAKLSSLPFELLSSSTPVVLVRKDDSQRKILHTIVSGLATFLCAWRIGQYYRL